MRKERRSPLGRVATKLHAAALLRAESIPGVRRLIRGSSRKDKSTKPASGDPSPDDPAKKPILADVQEIHRELAKVTAYSSALEAEVRELKAAATAGDQTDQHATPPASEDWDNATLQRDAESKETQEARSTAEHERCLDAMREEVGCIGRALHDSMEIVTDAWRQLSLLHQLVSVTEADAAEAAQLIAELRTGSSIKDVTRAQMAEKDKALEDVATELRKAQAALQLARLQADGERRARQQAEEEAQDLRTQLAEERAEAEAQHAENQRAMRSFKAKLAAMQSRSQEVWGKVEEKRNNVEQLQQQLQAAKSMKAQLSSANP